MLYILGMLPKIIEAQNKVLKALTGRIDDFYLGGGTALSLFYFNHRESLDLDFFTKDFSKKRIVEIITALSASLNRKIKLISEESRKGKIKILVYSLVIDRKDTLKIDFIEDYLDCIKPFKSVNGINILSLEDIYLRKIYAATGTHQTTDYIGRKISEGGRQEAKDFYDLYCLSQIFMRLSDFSFRYGNQLIRESIIRWFRTYSRFEVKTGLLELKIKKDINYPEIERHFKKEVDKIVEKITES
ncbi:MAG: nucleotidyl transferase AbiEii/AbiGii toxin family protein [Candidatus Omnitrophota bacterium]